MEKKNIIWILSLSIIIILLTAMFAVMLYQSREAPDGSHNISREDSSAFSTVSPPSGLPETDRDGGLADTRRDTSPHTEEDSGLAAFLAKQDAIADEMLKKMQIEASGNISLDFLYGILPLYQASANLSDNYLEHGGSNRELQDAAEDILEEQSEDTYEIQSLIRKLDRSGQKEKHNEQQFMKIYQTVVNSCQKMKETSADTIDSAFAQKIIQNFQAEIEIAEEILAHTDNMNVRKLAMDIIEDQTEEIRDIQHETL